MDSNQLVKYILDTYPESTCSYKDSIEKHIYVNARREVALDILRKMGYDSRGNYVGK